jgi:hypothetical protein
MGRLAVGCAVAALLEFACLRPASAYKGSERRTVGTIEKAAIAAAASQLTLVHMSVLPVPKFEDIHTREELFEFASNVGIAPRRDEPYDVLERLLGAGEAHVRILSTSRVANSLVEAEVEWRPTLSNQPLRLGKVLLRPGGNILVPSRQARETAQASIANALVGALERLAKMDALRCKEVAHPSTWADQTPDLSYESTGENVLWRVYRLGLERHDLLLKALAPQPMTSGFPQFPSDWTEGQRWTGTKEQRDWENEVARVIHHPGGKGREKLPHLVKRLLYNIDGARQHGFVRPLLVRGRSHGDPKLFYSVHTGGFNRGKFAFVRRARVK